jgi:hypothetical protein
MSSKEPISITQQTQFQGGLKRRYPPDILRAFSVSLSIFFVTHTPSSFDQHQLHTSDRHTHFQHTHQLSLAVMTYLEDDIKVAKRLSLVTETGKTTSSYA